MTLTHPADFPERILIAVTGSTPQILTETVFKKLPEFKGIETENSRT